MLKGYGQLCQAVKKIDNDENEKSDKTNERKEKNVTWRIIETKIKTKNVIEWQKKINMLNLSEIVS